MGVGVLEYQRMSDGSKRFHHSCNVRIPIGYKNLFDGGLGEVQPLCEIGFGYSPLSHGDVQCELGCGYRFESDEVLPRRDGAGRRDVPSGNYVSGKRHSERVLRHFERFGAGLAAGQSASNIGEYYVIAAAFFGIENAGIGIFHSQNFLLSMFRSLSIEASRPGLISP